MKKLILAAAAITLLGTALSASSRAPDKDEFIVEYYMDNSGNIVGGTFRYGWLCSQVEGQSWGYRTPNKNAYYDTCQTN